MASRRTNYLESMPQAHLSSSLKQHQVSSRALACASADIRVWDLDLKVGITNAKRGVNMRKQMLLSSSRLEAHFVLRSWVRMMRFRVLLSIFQIVFSFSYPPCKGRMPLMRVGAKPYRASSKGGSQAGLHAPASVDPSEVLRKAGKIIQDTSRY